MPLFEELYIQNTIAVETCLSTRRGLRKHLINQKLKKGKILGRKHGAVMVRETRVLVVSIKHTPAVQVVSVRITGGRAEKLKFIAVHDYNENMAGVDKSDQLLQYSSVKRKNI